MQDGEVPASMRNRVSRFRWVVALVLMLVCYEARAHAYLDPGTGSMVAQAIIAAITGAALVLRGSWTKIRSFSKSLFSRRRYGRRPTA